GTTAGWIVYAVYYAFARRGTSPFAVEKGYAAPIPEPSEQIAAADLLHTREPLVTLLPAADQERIAARFGYDHRHRARAVAVVLLVFSLLGVITSLRSGAVVAL